MTCLMGRGEGKAEGEGPLVGSSWLLRRLSRKPSKYRRCKCSRPFPCPHPFLGPPHTFLLAFFFRKVNSSRKRLSAGTTQ